MPTKRDPKTGRFVKNGGKPNCTECGKKLVNYGKDKCPSCAAKIRAKREYKKGTSNSPFVKGHKINKGREYSEEHYIQI